MTTSIAKKNVFISHHSKDDEHITRLTRLLANRGYEIRNSSIRTNKPENKRQVEQGMVEDETIRRLLRMKISWAGTVVVLIGEATHTRDWVTWEINQAKKQNKQIVGIHVRGGSENKVPDALDDYASSIVGWDTDRIIEAIEGETITFEDPDGSQRPPPHMRVTSNCEG